VFNTCTHTIHQLENWYYKIDPHTKLPTDEPVRKNNHAVDTVRYAAHVNPPYRRPRLRGSRTTSPVQRLLAAKQRFRQSISGKGNRRYLNIGNPE
jgi:hypothetical protein